MRDHIAHPCYVPARVWSLAQMAARNGWNVSIEPGRTRCDVEFWRVDGESVSIGWQIYEIDAYGHRAARLSQVSHGPDDIRLRDVPRILKRRPGGAR